MKVLLVGIMMCWFSVNGQTIENNQTVPVYEADPIIAGRNVLFIPVDFNASTLLNGIPPELKSNTIERIDLVYTTFAENPEFDQAELNKKRINQLKSEWPETQNPLINWKRIGQTQALDRTTARGLFHGFVVYYREKPTAESIEDELSSIDAYLEDGAFPAEKKMLPSRGMDTSESGSKESTPYTHEVSITESVDVRVPTPVGKSISDVDKTTARKLSKTPVEPIEGEHQRVSALRREAYQNECYTSRAGTKRCGEAQFMAFNDSMVRLPRADFSSYSWNTSTSKDISKATEWYYVYYSLKEECDTVSFSYAVDFSNPFSWDNKEFNAVQATFNRHPHWNNTHIVMDVTGSMSPYIAKTMAWVKATQDSSRVSAFTFFNDGDATPDKKKITGRVGGIYSVENSAFDPVYHQMKQTMRNGGGGDCPENNVEATISGMKKFPSCEEVIMVADNWATPRDLSLLKQINVPIHIIICGGQMGINVAYVQAAYETGGSVHTIEDDLDLRSIEPGKQFKIGRNYFTLLGGKIVRAEHK